MSILPLNQEETLTSLHSFAQNLAVQITTSSTRPDCYLEKTFLNLETITNSRPTHSPVSPSLSAKLPRRNAGTMSHDLFPLSPRLQDAQVCTILDKSSITSLRLVSHHTLADIQSCSLEDRVQASLALANIPHFQIHNSGHCYTGNLPLYPPFLPEPGFDECSLPSAKLLWAKPVQLDDCLAPKIDTFDYWH